MTDLILHNFNGAIGGREKSSLPNRLDNGSSHVFASSLYVNLDENGESIAKYKDSDDKIVIGYTRFGLPFQIVVDGFYGCDQNEVFSFIDKQVLPLIESVSNRLHQEEDTKNVIREFIQTIYELNKKAGNLAEFTLSIAITYPKNDEFYCAGFGIGDTGLVMKRRDGSISQLAYHVEVDGFKDAFDTYAAQDIETVIQRNTIFKTQVTPGDEIVGYTYLPSPLEIEYQQIASHALKHETPIAVRYLGMNPDLFSAERSLYSQLRKQIPVAQEALISQAKAAKQQTCFGDDFTMGCITIPDHELCKQIKLNHLLLQVKTTLNNYEKWYLEHSHFWQFFTKKKESEKGKEYLHLLEEFHDSPEQSTKILLKLFNDHREHLLQGYLAKSLSIDIADLKITLKQLFLQGMDDSTPVPKA